MKFLLPSDDRTRLMMIQRISLFALRTGHWPKQKDVMYMLGISKDRMKKLIELTTCVEVNGDEVTISINKKVKK